MTTQAQTTAYLGKLVVTVFDTAAQYSTDPEEVSQLATQTVMHILQRARRPLQRTNRSPKISTKPRTERVAEQQ